MYRLTPAPPLRIFPKKRIHTRKSTATDEANHDCGVSQVLTIAAKGGDWRAVNPCCGVTLPQLELLLCMPTTLFAVVR